MDINYSLEGRVSNMKHIDPIILQTNKAISEYEESDKQKTTIITLGLKLCYRLDQKPHVHRMSAVSRFSKYVAEDIDENEHDLSELILKRLQGQ
tara:strand:+ start:98 stop:379 length:282 start_codon:yes stop_codon:yes gene_type:complete